MHIITYGQWVDLLQVSADDDRILKAAMKKNVKWMEAGRDVALGCPTTRGEKPVKMATGAFCRVLSRIRPTTEKPGLR